MPTHEPCQRDAGDYCYRHTDPRICDANDDAGIAAVANTIAFTHAADYDCTYLHPYFHPLRDPDPAD